MQPNRGRPVSREEHARMQAARQQQMRQQRPNVAVAKRGSVRGSVRGTPQPHVPARRTQYQSAFDTDAATRNTDIKEILKTEIGRVGEQDVAYRLHRGDTSVADMNRDPVNDNIDPLDKGPEPQYKPGSIYVPSSAERSEIPRPVVFQGTPTARPTKEMLGISDIYVEFDSFEKLQPSQPENGLLVFSTRSANDENPIDSIIEMQIYPFYMPIIETDPLYQPNFYFYRRITVGIQNLAGTQFVKKLQKRDRWHFELETQNAGIVFRVEPTVHDGKYVFTKPVRDLSTAEFRFAAPDKVVTFPTDVFDATAVNPADFGPGGNQRIVTATPHGLTVGTSVAVFVKEFNSNNSNFNTIMNSEIGHIVDVVSSTKLQFTGTPSSTLLGTSVDSSGNPTTMKLCIGERRVRFVVRFRRILPTLTNWISP